MEAILGAGAKTKEHECVCNAFLAFARLLPGALALLLPSPPRLSASATSALLLGFLRIRRCARLMSFSSPCFIQQRRALLPSRSWPGKSAGWKHHTAPELRQAFFSQEEKLVPGRLACLPPLRQRSVCQVPEFWRRMVKELQYICSPAIGTVDKGLKLRAAKSTACIHVIQAHSLRTLQDLRQVRKR